MVHYTMIHQDNSILSVNAGKNFQYCPLLGLATIILIEICVRVNSALYIFKGSSVTSKFRGDKLLKSAMTGN